MWYSLKRLSLGFGLIALASLVLLLADLQRRDSAAARPRVAVLQFTKSRVVDEAVAGIVEGLAQRGFEDGRNVELRHFEAGGDMGTLNAIARELTGGGYTLVVTATTPALQAVAGANREGRVPHVFGVVTDPFAAGVGISREDPRRHPPHLAGYGSMQPVPEGFRLARELNPRLASVGVVWNPAEANSEASVKRAREVSAELKLTLLEATVENSAGVGEAAASLVARGAEALWIGGDSTAIAAQKVLIAIGREARIPTFTCQPGTVKDGALFDLGANYHEVGRVTGDLAGQVLAGRSPAEFAVENLVPVRLLLNEAVLAGLGAGWSVPASVRERVEKPEAVAASPQPSPPARRWHVVILAYNSMLEAEESEAGIRDGFRDAGLQPGRDLTLETLNAQGDMATLPTLVDAAVSKGADLLMPLATPTLQATLKRAGDRPVVFSLVASPSAAGAGPSLEQHLPHVTGVATASAYRELIELVRELLPQARRIGTLYVPSEANSVYNLEQVQREAARAGLAVEAVAVGSSSEVADAALALTSRRIEAVCQVASNLTTASFAAIAQAAARNRVPVFGFMGSNVRDGALAAVSRDYYDGGKQAAVLALRVMRGESPAWIPIQPLATTRLVLNQKLAGSLGVKIPEAVAKRAAASERH